MDKNKYFMMLAKDIAKGSTCPRNEVGCVLVDDAYRIIGTGYNGVPRNHPHCISTPCPRQNSDLPDGKGIDTCHAIHAEQNALMHCNDILKIKTVYTTDFPCFHCMKMLANTSANLIVFKRGEPLREAVNFWKSVPDRYILNLGEQR